MAMDVMTIAVAVFAAATAGPTSTPAGQTRLRVRSFLPVKPLSRARRPAGIETVIEKMAAADVAMTRS